MSRDPDRYHAGSVGHHAVTMTEWGWREPLPPRNNIFNHSPSGFSWGYGGSGPAQLALALLVDVVGTDRAVTFHQDFRWQWTAPLPQDTDWSMTASEVLAWVENAERVTARQLGAMD